MKEKINRVIKHPLVSGSIIIFAGSLFGNLFNFLFNLYMSRSLTVSDYGILASLTSIIALSLVVAGAPMPTIINFSASYFAKNDIEKLHGLYFKFSKYYIILAIIIFLLFVIFPGQIGDFFHIHNKYLIIFVGFIIFISIISTVNIGFLQAKLAFTFSSIINLLSSILKFVFGFIFVNMGFGVFGTMMAYLCSSIFPYFLSFIPLLFLFTYKLKTPKVNTVELLFYGVPSAITMFGLNSFISMDIVLVKHFFNPAAAGQYAGLSLVSRVIFFFSAPVASVIFPIITQKNTKKEKYHNTFILAVIMVLLPSVMFNIFYFLFPDFTIIFFLKKKEYLHVTHLLWIFGLYITVYSLFYLFTNFYLSIKKTKIFIPISIGLLIQIVLISLFHKTFISVILISFAIVGILLAGFILYFFKNIAFKKQE